MTLLRSFSFRLRVVRKFEEPVITFQFLVALSHMARRTFWQEVFIHIWKGLMSWIASSDRSSLCTSLLSRLSSWLSVTRGNSEVATVRTSRSYRSFVWIVPQLVYFHFYCFILIYKSRNIYCICLVSKIARLLGVKQFNLVYTNKYLCFEGWYAPAKLLTLDNSNFRIYVILQIYSSCVLGLFTY
jgi:hypothetical protein